MKFKLIESAQDIKDELWQQFKQATDKEIIDVVGGIIPNVQKDTPMFVTRNGDIIGVKYADIDKEAMILSLPIHADYVSGFLYNELQRQFPDESFDEIYKGFFDERREYGREGSNFLTNEKGWVRLNPGTTNVEKRFYMVLPLQRPTQAQWDAIEAFLEAGAEMHKQDVLVFGDNGDASHFYSLYEYTPEEILGKLKRYYASGKFYEELNEVYPNKGESKEDFISRFMKVTAKEYPDRKQRYAVALSYWNRRNKNKNLSESILETDSKGNTLSDEQLMYFKNSKIRDSSGNLQLMLHGTNKGEFPYFRCQIEPQFFTKDYDTAYEYSLPRDDGKDIKSLIYNVYLNIEKPFDLSTKRQKDILIDFLNKKNINKFSKEQINGMNRVPFTVADDLYSYLKQNFRNEFDGLIVDEGTSYKEGNNLDKTTSYVPFYSYQIKRISNKKPTRSVYIDK